MFYRHNPSAAEKSSSLTDVSDAEEIFSISDDDAAQEEANDRLLAQAINYLQQEGGDDSHETFIERVNRIDESLLKQLPHQGLMFDLDLYWRARTLINSVRRDFEDASEADSLEMGSNEELTHDDSLMASDDEAFYRADSSSPTPTPAPSIRRTFKALAPRRPESEYNVQTERSFKYGGDGETENWYKDYPASLPFPETLMMTHWESLKIDFDRNRPKDAAIAEIVVSLDEPEIKQYFELPLYESGSRFKLPTVRFDDQVAVNRLGTKIHLKRVVDKFYERDQTSADKDYVPSLFLEKFNVEQQWAPELLRRELNATPTKIRTPQVNSTAHLHELGKAASASHNHKARQRVSSPAFRRISKEVRRSESQAALVHSTTFSTKPKPSTPDPATFSTRSKPASTTKVLSHVAIPVKRPRGHPPKNPKPVAVATPNPTPSKRKASLGSQPYQTPKSSIKKVLRDTKRRKSADVVEAPVALEEDSEDPNYPASPIRRPTRKTGSMKANKATSVGKISRARKDNGHVARTGGRLTTRSGKAYY